MDYQFVCGVEQVLLFAGDGGEELLLGVLESVTGFLPETEVEFGLSPEGF